MLQNIPISLLARLYAFGAGISLLLVLYVSSTPTRAITCLFLGWLLAIAAIILNIQAEHVEHNSEIDPV